MDVKFMRAELEKKYSSAFVAKMPDLQVIAMYRRLKLANKI